MTIDVLRTLDVFSKIRRCIPLIISSRIERQCNTKHFGFPNWLSIIVLVSVLLLSAPACAQVQTWFDPSYSVAGDVRGARFGSSLSCGVASDPSTPGSSEPLLAVGAPDENNGAGAVYVYRTKSISSAPQRLISPNPGPGRGFGTAILFVNDTDGGGAPELVVTEPNASGFNAKVWAFKSLTGTTFFACEGGEATLPAGSGESMVNIPDVSGPAPGGSVFVVGSPNRSAVDSLRLMPVPGFPLQCPLSTNGLYSATGEAGSGYGFSLISIPYSDGPRLLAGAPSYNSFAGRTYLQSQADFFSGGSTPQVEQDGASGELQGFGAAIYNTHFAVSAPGSQSLYVKRNTSSDVWVDLCTVSIPLAQGGPQSLAAADHIASSWFGSNQFFAYRIQSETGGSVGFTGADDFGCDQPRTYNNCIFDEQQEQGSAIVGHGCLAPISNSLDNAVVVGSPGWNGGRGRVDIVVRGTEFQDAKTCDTPTPTPSPTPTPISGTPTPTPTSTPEGANFGGGSRGPILVEPGSGGLPPSKLSAPEGGSAVRIELPRVALKDRTVLAKLLARRLRITNRRANVLAARPVNLFYQVTVVTTPNAGRRAAFSLSDVLVGSAFANEDRKKRMFNTRDRITTARASPGSRVDVFYRVGIQIVGQKSPVYTKASPTATIRL
jgi:hypothetical protein